MTLLLNDGLIDEHDWDVVSHGIDPLAFDTLKSAAVVFQNYGSLTNRTYENVQQLLADGHETT